MRRKLKQISNLSAHEGGGEWEGRSDAKGERVLA